MATYRVEVEVSGYCRGYQVWLIEADSEEEAKDSFWAGEFISEEIILDDREGEVVSAKEDPSV